MKKHIFTEKNKNHIGANKCDGIFKIYNKVFYSIHNYKEDFDVSEFTGWSKSERNNINREEASVLIRAGAVFHTFNFEIDIGGFIKAEIFDKEVLELFYELLKEVVGKNSYCDVYYDNLECRSPLTNLLILSGSSISIFIQKLRSLLIDKKLHRDINEYEE